MKRRSRIHSSLAVVLPLTLSTTALPAWAQDKWHSKNITCLAPFPAGDVGGSKLE